MENLRSPSSQIVLVRVIKGVIVGLGLTLIVALVASNLDRLIPWRLTSDSKPISLCKGATYVTKGVKGPVETELHLIFFDTQSCDLRVAEQPSKKDARTIEEFARAAGAIAACNGGYFDVPNFLPAGLQIVAGKRQGDLVKNPLWGCVLVRSGVADVVPVEDFKDEKTVTDLVQCSPMYVMDGRAVQIGPGGPRNTRTFALTDQMGHWAIGTCKNIGLQELADLLATPTIISEFAVKRALNLDGGPSTGLWFKDEMGAIHSEKEAWRVKNMLLIAPKK